MSQPWKPTPSPTAGRTDPQGAPWPGLIPLRPLGIGDVFGAAFRLVRTHAGLLCPVALAGTLIGAAAALVVAGLQPDDAAAVEDRWFTQLAAGVLAAPPMSIVLTLLVGALISYLTTIVVSGLATALIGDASIGRPTGSRTALERMHGRWGALLAVSAVVSVLVLAGFVAFVVPGFLILAMLLVAAPIAVLEKAGPGTALRRAVRLSQGGRGRILGTTVLAFAITAVIGDAVQSLLPASASFSATVIALSVQALVSALTVPWTASVIALLYVDARIRREGLAPALLRSSMS